MKRSAGLLVLVFALVSCALPDGGDDNDDAQDADDADDGDDTGGDSDVDTDSDADADADSDSDGSLDANCQDPTGAATAGSTNVISATATELSGDANPCATEYPAGMVLDCISTYVAEQGVWRSRIKSANTAARGLPSIALILVGEPASGSLSITSDPMPAAAGTGQVVVQELGASTFKEWISTGGSMQVAVSGSAVAASIDPEAVQVSVNFDVTMEPTALSQGKGQFRLQGTAQCDPLLGWPE